MVKKKGKLGIVKRGNNFRSQEDGRQLERAYYTIAKSFGYDIERTSRGSDYRIRKTDSMGKGIGKWKYIEIKTGNALKSKLQKLTEKKVGKGNYETLKFGW